MQITPLHTPKTLNFCWILTVVQRNWKKTVVNSRGIEHSAAKRGFSDRSIELYYLDHVKPGNPKKAAFILRTDETIGMLRASESATLVIRLSDPASSIVSKRYSKHCVREFIFNLNRCKLL